MAQLVTLIGAPIVTRLYTPEQFGEFGLFLSMSAILSVGITFRYEKAIMLPAARGSALSLVKGVIGVSVILTLLIQIVAWLAGEWLLRLFDISMGLPAFLLVPLGGLFLAISQILINWQLYQKNFRVVAASKFVQALSVLLAQFAFVSICFRLPALVAAQLLGYLCGAALLAFGGRVWRKSFSIKSFLRIRSILFKYRDFPKYSLPADLLNVVSNQLPVILVGKAFGIEKAGLYLLTQRVLAGPSGVIGNAVLDVFKQQASSDFREFGNCKAVYIQTFKILASLSLPPGLILLFWGPDLFEFVFGVGWRNAGEFAQILSPMLMFGFVASPLSYVVYIARKQKLDLIWQFGILLVTLSSFFFGKVFGEVKFGLALFSGAYSIMYMIYMWLSYRLSCGAFN